MAEFSSFFGTLSALETQNALRRSRVDAELGARALNESLRRSRNDSSPLKMYAAQRQLIQTTHNRIDDSIKGEMRHTQNALRRQKLMADLALARRHTDEQYRREQQRGMIRQHQEVYDKLLMNQLKQEQYLASQALKRSRNQAQIQHEIYKNLIHRYV